MSGGIDPTCEINLPKPESKSPKKLGFLNFRHLNSLAIMLFLSTTGMITLQHFGLVIFSTIYIIFLSKFSFPRTSITQEKPVFGPKSKILSRYILFAAILGLFLPILYIFEGIFHGDTEGIKGAVPHVFLLASQVFMEGVSASSRFSLPIRVFVPVFYNSVRMWELVEWVKCEFIRVGEIGSIGRLYVGRSLAVANLGLWGYNLFGFLLPVYLPKAFQIYYGGNVSDSKTE